MNTNQVQKQLEIYYRERLPGYHEARVTEVVSINEGWESVIYAFKLNPGAKTDKPPQDLILRIYPGTDARYKSQREYEGLRILDQAGYPVPQVFALERDDSPFDGRPFILMERVAGEMMWPVLDRAKPDQAAALLSQFCGLFVQLHRLDWREFVPLPDQDSYQDPYFAVDGFLNMIRQEAGNFPDLNNFSAVLDWLVERRNMVPCARPAAVHWDFHPGNIILKPDGDAVVIDWTQIQVSDPRFDLGWTLLLAQAYTGDDVRGMILDGYQQIAGESIEELAFFDVASCLKRLGSVMISISAGADSIGMRPDAVAMMRRDFPALRKVYDLMVGRTGILVSAVEQLLDS